MLDQWLSADLGEVSMVLLTSAATYVAILCYTRVTGLRSFSKMSAADFAMTVAVGSLFASTISSPKPTLMIGLVAIGSLFFGQWLLAYGRRKSDRFSKMVDNQPLLLMHGSTILDENLSKAKVTRDDLFGKLREANALSYDEVIAVVFETTGDVSVLHSEDPDARLEADFVVNVVQGSTIQRLSS